MIALPAQNYRVVERVRLTDRCRPLRSAQVLACGRCQRQGRVAQSHVKHAQRPVKLKCRRLAAKEDNDQELLSQSSQPLSNRQQTQQQDDSIPTRGAIFLIQAYKDWISPVLPSVCRFQPSCSTYSIEAFQQFGPAKGITLMAWRILRCNPFRGGYQGQYDPPKWPPVGFERLFKAQE